MRINVDCFSRPATRPRNGAPVALFTLIALLALIAAAPAVPDEGWATLFNGKDLTGWKANRHPESWEVVDGAIRGRATQPASHLFYVGEGKAEPGSPDGGLVRFKNFEMEATVRGEPNANSGIFFHTDMTPRDAAGYLAKGYEVQLNSTPREKRKTGSLYAVVDLDRSPVDETQWFKVGITVRGNRIQVRLNEKQVIDYTEPENVQRPRERVGRKLDPEGNGIALQAHDPQSIFHFKNLRIRRLP